MDLTKLTALKGSKGFKKDLDALRKTHATCQARVSQLEAGGGQTLATDRREIASLRTTIARIESVWQAKIDALERTHRDQLKASGTPGNNNGLWCTNDDSDTWKKKYDELVKQHSKEKAKLATLNSSLPTATDPVEIQKIRKEISACEDSKKQLEDRYEKQLRDLSVKLSQQGPGRDGDTAMSNVYKDKVEDLERKLNVMTNGNKSMEHLAIYIKLYGVLPPAAFIDVSTLDGVKLLALKVARVTSWVGISENIDSVKGVNNIFSLALKHKSYLEKQKENGGEKNPPSKPWEADYDMYERLEKKIHSNKIEDWDQETTDFFHHGFAMQFGGEPELKAALESFTDEQLGESKGISKIISDVTEGLSSVNDRTDYSKKTKSIKYLAIMTEQLCIQIINLFERYIPQDFDSPFDPSDPKAIKLTTVYTKKMLEANPNPKPKFGDIIGMITEMRNNTLTKQILRAILNGDDTTKVGKSLGMVAGSQMYKIFVMPFIYRSIIQSVKTVNDTLPIIIYLNDMARVMIDSILKIDIPPPTMDFVQNNAKPGDDIFIAQEKDGFKNPLDTVDEKELNRLVAATVGYNPNNSKRIPPIIPPPPPFIVNTGYNEVEHGGLYKKVRIYVFAEAIMKEMLDISSKQYTLIEPSLKTATAGGIVMPKKSIGEDGVEVTKDEFSTAIFNPDVIIKALQKPTDVREFINTHTEFMEGYTKENPDVEQFDLKIRNKWDSFTDQYYKLQCCVEYFLIESMLLATLNTMDPKLYETVTMKDVVNTMDPIRKANAIRKEQEFQTEKKRLNDLGQDLHKGYEIGVNSLCSDIHTLVDNRDAFGRAWKLDLSRGLTEKLRRTSKFTEEWIQRFVYPAQKEAEVKQARPNMAAMLAGRKQPDTSGETGRPNMAAMFAGRKQPDTSGETGRPNMAAMLAGRKQPDTSGETGRPNMAAMLAGRKQPDTPGETGRPNMAAMLAGRKQPDTPGETGRPNMAAMLAGRKQPDTPGETGSEKPDASGGTGRPNMAAMLAGRKKQIKPIDKPPETPEQAERVARGEELVSTSRAAAGVLVDEAQNNNMVDLLAQLRGNMNKKIKPSNS